VIWHFVEVWLLFLGVFVVGCGLGASVYVGLSRGPLATAQGIVADAVGDIIDEIKWRLGVAPDWRPGYEPPERQQQRTTDEHEFAAGSREVLAPPRSTAEILREGQENRLQDLYRDEASVSDRKGTEAEKSSAPGNNLEVRGGDRPRAGEGLFGDESSTMRPAGLTAPRSGVPDNLQRIRGVGKRNEALLHSLGIFHFGQIAAWTPAEARWVASRLAFPERLEADDWIGQSIILASGGDTRQITAAERKRRPEPDEAED
jgi:predicted flap endonuclease-1-like 5' DNA nuclease